MGFNGDFGSETKYNTLIKYFFSWGLVRLLIASSAIPRSKGGCSNLWISLLNPFNLLVAWLMQFISRVTSLFVLWGYFPKPLPAPRGTEASTQQKGFSRLPPNCGSKHWPFCFSCDPTPIPRSSFLDFKMAETRECVIHILYPTPAVLSCLKHLQITKHVVKKHPLEAARIQKLFRFSAFWLRSKCSICSYQLNIWYRGHVPLSILNWFLEGDRV